MDHRGRSLFGKRPAYALDRGRCLGGHPQAFFAHHGVAQVGVGRGKFFTHVQIIPVKRKIHS